MRWTEQEFNQQKLEFINELIIYKTELNKKNQNGKQ